MADIDFQSETWRAVVAIAQKHRADHLAELATPNKDERRSDELRGAIAEIDTLLTLAAPKTVQRAMGTDNSGYPI